MIDIMQIADHADMIINGYAFTREGMHVHASDRKLTESGSAKLFVKSNGDSVIQNQGILNEREIHKIQEFIKKNYQEMYLKWAAYSKEGFYEK